MKIKLEEIKDVVISNPEVTRVGCPLPECNEQGEYLVCYYGLHHLCDKAIRYVHNFTLKIYNEIK